MSFITVSHWEAKTWNKEDETKATEKYVPMIMSLGAKSVKMCKTDELNFMVITEWSNGQVAKVAAVALYVDHPPDQGRVHHGIAGEAHDVCVIRPAPFGDPAQQFSL